MIVEFMTNYSSIINGHNINLSPKMNVGTKDSSFNSMAIEDRVRSLVSDQTHTHPAPHSHTRRGTSPHSPSTVPPKPQAISLVDNNAIDPKSTLPCFSIV
jgi:hypothetical protein